MGVPIKDELQDLMLLSKEFRTKIDNSKTKTKKDLYLKKLKKNNTRIMNILVILDSLSKKEKPVDEIIKEELNE